MNCQNHPDVPAVAFCRACGKPLCEACRRDAYGTIFCQEHAPVPAAQPMPAGPQGAPRLAARPDVSPGLALGLGFIPGVGAIYNGQYAKGLVHAVIFGTMVSILGSGSLGGTEPVFGILLTAWIFYMVFEAYHTARKRKYGEPVDEFSSLLPQNSRANQLPVVGIVLIVLGGVLLLDTLGFFDFRAVARYWPVLLIAAGAYMLYSRFTHASSHEEATNERQ